MSRRLSTLLAALVPAILLLVLLSTATVPLVAMGPGPTFDTLGVVGGQGGEGVPAETPVIVVHGRDPDPTSGRLEMTTVAVRDHLTLADAFRYWLDPEQTVVPRDQVFPPGRSRQEVEAGNKADLTDSENSAELAAYRHLALPLEARVGSVAADGAAAGILRTGDVLVAVDGKQTPRASDVVSAVAGRGPGEKVAVEYRRGTVPARAEVSLRAASGEDGRATDKGYLGIAVGDSPADGTDVVLTMDPSVGGPSAGLMFALGIVDKLSPGELTGGRDIAGTGTISGDGRVGPIGGVRHKILAARASGATEFLVPAANCTEARTSPPEGIRLIRVETLDGAVHALQAIATGETPPTCG